MLTNSFTCNPYYTKLITIIFLWHYYLAAILRSVFLYECVHVDAEGMRAIGSLGGRITSLDLRSRTNQVTDEGVQKLASLTALATLSLTCTNMTDEGVRDTILTFLFFVFILQVYATSPRVFVVLLGRLVL